MSLQINQATFHLNVNHFNCLGFKLDSTPWKQMIWYIDHSKFFTFDTEFSTKASFVLFFNLANKLIIQYSLLMKGLAQSFPCEFKTDLAKN